MRRHAALALLLIAAAPALAQERPQLTPTRDVTVTYRGSGATPGRPGETNQINLTIAWHVATQTMRSDIDGVGWMVADHRNGRAFMVMEAARMIMDVPLSPAMVQHGFSQTAAFRREGTATVAGQRCTNFAVQDGPNQGTVCVSAEGVMLRSQGTFQGGTGNMEATEVRFAATDPARFQRPAGYQSMQVPGQMPGGGTPGQPPRR